MLRRQKKSQLQQKRKDQRQPEMRINKHQRIIKNLNRRKKIIREQMKFSWPWCRLSKNHLPKIMIRIRMRIGGLKLLNQTEDVDRGAEDVDVVKEVIEEALDLIKEMSKAITKNTKQLIQHHHQKTRVHHSMTLLILHQKKRKYKRRSLRRSKKKQKNRKFQNKKSQSVQRNPKLT